MRSNPWKQSKKGRKKIGVGFKQNDDDDDGEDDDNCGRRGGSFWSSSPSFGWLCHIITYFFVS